MSEENNPGPDPAQATQPICGFVVTMAPNGDGFLVRPLGPESGVQRTAGKMDELALCTAWSHTLQAQSTVHLSVMVEDQREGAMQAAQMEAAALARASKGKNGGLHKILRGGRG